MTFDIAQLDEFAGGFARTLFSAYPDWVDYARVEIADAGETPDLVVDVPLPGSHESLLIYTQDTEVTVSFDTYHNHFNWPADDIDMAVNPVSLIAAILNEEVAVASGWNDDKWVGSWLVKKGEQVRPPENFSSMKTIRVRSWNGTLDQDLSPI